jgi:hypothetical protein
MEDSAKGWESSLHFYYRQETGKVAKVIAFTKQRVMGPRDKWVGSKRNAEGDLVDGILAVERGPGELLRLPLVDDTSASLAVEQRT